MPDRVYNSSASAPATPPARSLERPSSTMSDKAGSVPIQRARHQKTAHWGLEDSAAVDGPEFKQRAEFEDALRYLRNRIGAFINLPLASIDRMALNSKLEGIGAMDGTTTKSSNVA